MLPAAAGALSFVPLVSESSPSAAAAPSGSPEAAVVTVELHGARVEVRGTPDSLSRRSLAWHKTEVTHKLTWALKTAHVTDLGRECHCDDQIDAAQCLKRPHERLQRPGRDELFDRALEPVDRKRSSSALLNGA